jgi:hypothetical protein
MTLLEIILVFIGIYLAIGVVFALYFVAFHITKFDETAKNSSIFFRVIIFFGATFFWLNLAFQIFNNKEKIEITAHRL